MLFSLQTDVIDCDFAIEWMRNFEAFQRALDAQRSATLDGVDWVDGPFVDSDSSQYMTSLTNSMALVLDEFYNDLKSCGVSSFSGDGMPRFLELVKDATAEYYNVSFFPMIEFFLTLEALNFLLVLARITNYFSLILWK